MPSLQRLHPDLVFLSLSSLPFCFALLIQLWLRSPNLFLKPLWFFIFLPSSWFSLVVYFTIQWRRGDSHGRQRLCRNLQVSCRFFRSPTKFKFSQHECYNFFFFLLLNSDLRLGVQAQTITRDFKKVFQVTDKLYVGLTGLATDVISIDQLLKFRCNMYKLQENREIKPEAFSGLLSTLLYEKRFSPWFCEPVVAGLDSDNNPFLSGMDLIGAPVFADKFVVCGTCTPNLHGMCESLYEPDLVSSSIWTHRSSFLTILIIFVYW